MNLTSEKSKKDLAENFIESSKTRSLSDQKRELSYKVSDRELYENMYYWDPSIYRFIRVGRLY
jgi:hypothetical protein